VDWRWHHSRAAPGHSIVRALVERNKNVGGSNFQRKMVDVLRRSFMRWPCVTGPSSADVKAMKEIYSPPPPPLSCQPPTINNAVRSGVICGRSDSLLRETSLRSHRQLFCYIWKKVQMNKFNINITRSFPSQSD